ncbi:flagellar basal body rod protein FlgC [Mucisphaera calidilacus]|uniref:Flagellar basal-body rod protein FlgC n=1 Tax=Mucisphaera calidilacus TaxID=2527982 RepID=A0A518BYZ1_9BACT|nr:flagellar basal body rod protein FlgC [Mucisphaera calidilacus]QDU72189.1 Flagellar basal-body rod protein FlgC [Mucisphaera calidilacus]
MFGSLNTSASALVAQRTRLEVIAANIANQNSIYNAKGEYDPYRRRIAVFAPGDPDSGTDQGVHVREIMIDQSPFARRLDEDHPLADKDGYVYYPNISGPMEQINALEASRAYEANITAAEATKAMLRNTLRLLA